MITFSYDYKMYDVERSCKIKDVKTVNSYRIYGLKEENNPPILIEYNYNLFKKEFTSKEQKEMIKFFKRNGIKIVFKEDKFEKTFLVSVGIRKDLRASTNLSACLIQTIIFYFENKFDLDENFKIPGIQRMY